MVSTSEVIASIASGHSFKKHIQIEGHFENLGIDTKVKLANHIQDIFNDPSTKAFVMGQQDGVLNVFIMNENTNTYLALSPSKDNGDLGTIFEVKKGAKFKFESKLSDAKKGVSDVYEIKNLTELDTVLRTYGARANIDQTIEDQKRTIRDEIQSPEVQNLTQYLNERLPSVLETRRLVEQRLIDERDQQKAQAAKRTEQANRDKERVGVRKKIIKLANSEDSKITQENGKVTIEEPDGTEHDIYPNRDGTSTVITLDAQTGDIRETKLNHKDTIKIADKIPDLKGIMGEAFGVVLATGASFVAGSSPAEAVEDGIDSVAFRTHDAISNKASVPEIGVAVTKDFLAGTVPETVEAIEHEGSALHVTNAAAKDILVSGACIVGGAALGSASGIAGSITGPGAIALATGGSVIGCGLASMAMESTIDITTYAVYQLSETTKKAIGEADNALDKIINYFSNDEIKEVPLDDIRSVLPKGITSTTQPEMGALIEAQSSDEQLKEVAHNLKTQGNSGFVIKQMKERDIELKTQAANDTNYKQNISPSNSLQSEATLKSKPIYTP